MTIPVILITSPSGITMKYEQMIEKEHLRVNQLQRLKDEQKLAKSRAQNYRILEATAQVAFNGVADAASFAVGATGFVVELGMAAYDEYAPSGPQILRWIGSSLPSIPEFPTLTDLYMHTGETVFTGLQALKDVPLQLPEVSWHNPLTPTIAS